MKMLGIDYGRKKIGLAIGDTDLRLAEPLKVIKFEDLETLIEQLGQVVQKEKVEQVVMGVSEGEMAKETREFGGLLQKKLEVPVKYQDETLTTHEAQRLSIESGIKRKKKKGNGRCL